MSSKLIILSFEEFDVCAEALTCLLEFIKQNNENTSAVISSLRDVIINTLSIIHPQVSDRLLECLTIKHNWNQQRGQFNGHIDFQTLKNDIDEIFDMFHSI